MYILKLSSLQDGPDGGKNILLEFYSLFYLLKIAAALSRLILSFSFDSIFLKL